jgi:2-polyprenyl-3-methyl-5-hydroxy-6-metoxy-1,4-benzoquinol methylase
VSDGTGPPSIPGDYQYVATYHGPVSQRLWHLRKHDVLRRHLAGTSYARICDAGCGSGVLARLASELCPGAEVRGLDVDPGSVAFARETYGGAPRLVYEVRDLLRPPAAGEPPFDFVYSMEVIEHFAEEDVGRYLATLRALGHPATRYLLTTPDYGSLWPLIEWTLDAWSLVPPLKGHQHLTRFTRKRLVATVERHGFRVRGLYRFCGVSPFLGQVSLRLSDLAYRLERRLGVGNLLCCEMDRE